MYSTLTVQVGRLLPNLNYELHVGAWCNLSAVQDPQWQGFKAMKSMLEHGATSPLLQDPQLGFKEKKVEKREQRSTGDSRYYGARRA